MAPEGDLCNYTHTLLLLLKISDRLGYKDRKV